MKKIVLKAQKVGIFGENKYIVVIAEQTHRKDNFGKSNDNFFMASNGLLLRSDSYPMFSSVNKTIYLRGGEFGRDLDVIFVNAAELELIKMAVKEYNECFRDNSTNNSDIIIIQ